jgi:hypothetical protein
MTNKDLLAEHPMAQTSPKQAARSVLVLKAAKHNGRGATRVSMKLSEDLDSSQPDFASEAHLEQMNQAQQ